MRSKNLAALGIKNLVRAADLGHLMQPQTSAAQDVTAEETLSSFGLQFEDAPENLDILALHDLCKRMLEEEGFDYDR